MKLFFLQKSFQEIRKILKEYFIYILILNLYVIFIKVYIS